MTYSLKSGRKINVFIVLIVIKSVKLTLQNDNKNVFDIFDVIKQNEHKLIAFNFLHILLF